MLLAVMPVMLPLLLLHEAALTVTDPVFNDGPETFCTTYGPYVLLHDVSKGTHAFK
jgi:hypothetical protein